MSLIYPLGNPFIELQQVESTNNYATGLVHAGMAQPGTVIFTHHQTKGKGQRNKQWQDQGRKNIAMSVVVKPAVLVLSQSFLLSMATAVGVHHFFAKYAGPETKVKWPNDLFWRDRKAGGILLENIVKGNKWETTVVGIGININQTEFGSIGTKAVSLKQITGKDYDPVQLAKELCDDLSKAYAVLVRLPSHIMASYRNNLYKLNEVVRLKQGSRVFDATIKEVSSLGELIVEHGTEEKFNVGEVEWVI